MGQAAWREYDPSEVAGDEEARFSRVVATPDAETSEKRRQPRYSVELDVSMGSEHNFFAGFVENISAGGIFVATHRRAAIGEQFQISVSLPGMLPKVEGIAEVRWFREPNEETGQQPGMGLRFVALTRESVVGIEQFCAHRDPLFYDD